MNPLTSAAGIVAIICALGGAMDKYFDDDPATMPNWTDTGGAVAVGVGLIFAKDRERKPRPPTDWRENGRPG